MPVAGEMAKAVLGMYRSSEGRTKWLSRCFVPGPCKGVYVHLVNIQG